MDTTREGKGFSHVVGMGVALHIRHRPPLAISIESKIFEIKLGEFCGNTMTSAEIYLNYHLNDKNSDLIMERSIGNSRFLVDGVKFDFRTWRNPVFNQ